MPDDTPVCRHGHPRSPENTDSRRRCRECKRIQGRAARRAAGAREQVFDPERFPCGHPRTPENRKGGKGGCKECHRVKESARYAAKLAAEGRDKWQMDPDWFPCGHPRVVGNFVAKRNTCRVCHIDRAARSYREDGKGGVGNPDVVRERNRAYMECRREERGDPETSAYLPIIRRDPCSYCGGPGGTRDHIVSMLAESGPNHWANYTGACVSCNVAKGDKSLLTYLLDRMLFQRIRQARIA